MAATPQSQAIQNMNQIMSLAQQLLGLYNGITALNNAWNDDGSLTVVENMGTVALNADGTLGANDASANTSHPMNTATYTSLNRAVSVNTITSALTQLNNVVSFINGNALSATVGVRSVLNEVTGG